MTWHVKHVSCLHVPYSSISLTCLHGMFLFFQLTESCNHLPSLSQEFQMNLSIVIVAFYSAPQCSHCKRCISYGNSVCPSVRLQSVCPSHAGIVSKRRHVARCSLHCWIAKCVLVLQKPKKYSQGRPLPPEILAPSYLPTPEGSEF